jgi:hypothetical protein
MIPQCTVRVEEVQGRKAQGPPTITSACHGVALSGGLPEKLKNEGGVRLECEVRCRTVHHEINPSADHLASPGASVPRLGRDLSAEARSAAGTSTKDARLTASLGEAASEGLAPSKRRRNC